MVGFDPTHGRQLFVSDGTQAGTARLTETGVVHPAYGFGKGKDSGVSGLTPAGGKLYFVAGDAANGRRLWVSDGTPGGTRMVKAVAANPPAERSAWQSGPGWQAAPAKSDPAVLAVLGDLVLFSADDGVNGRELWVTDGTAANTRRVTDLAAGRASGVGDPDDQAPPESAAVADGRIVFAGTDGPRGLEPWSLPVSDLAPVSPPPAPVPPPASPPPGPPTSPPPSSPPAPPPASPPATPAPPARAAVTRTFAVSATEDTAFTANLAAVNLAAGPTYRVTVFWGDGRTSVGTVTPTGGGKFLVSARHTYAEPGSYRVMVRVTADFRTVLSIDAVATFADARFYAGRVAQRLPAGRAFAGVATVLDLNPTGGKAADYSATIDWGDGRTSAGQVRRTSSGRFEVVGEHTFQAPGRRTVTVTVRSGAWVTATAASLFLVDPPSPAVRPGPVRS